MFVLARSWKQAAENSQRSFDTSTQTALRAIYIIADSLISWLGHKRLQLYDLRRIIHKELDIQTYQYVQRHTRLTIPLYLPFKKQWNQSELRYLEELLLLTQHLHCVWVLFPGVHHFLTRFRSTLRSNIDRIPKSYALPCHQVIRQTWCSMTPYLSPSDVTKVSMTRHALLHLHRQMEATYATLAHNSPSVPPQKKKRGGGRNFDLVMLITAFLFIRRSLSLVQQTTVPQPLLLASVLIRRFRLPFANIPQVSSPLSDSWHQNPEHRDPPLDDGIHLLKDLGQLRSMPSLLIVLHMKAA